MLSRSSFSIRRLMRPRIPGSDDAENHTLRDERGHAATKSLDRGITLDQNRSLSSSKTSKPRPIVVVRDTATLRRISGPLPPLPNTPQSSASSLCSCEDHESNTFPSAYGGIPRLCSTDSKDEAVETEDLVNPLYRASLPALPIATRSDRMNHLYAISQSTAFRNRRPSSPPEETDSGYSESVPDEGTPRCSKEDEGLSDDARRLIMQTDEAFRAVGLALDEARIASRDFPSSSSYSSEPMSPTFTRPRAPPIPGKMRATPPPPPPPTPPPKHTLKRPIRSPGISSPLNSPTRNASVSKPRRRKSKKSKQKEPLRPPQSTFKTKTRWTITENMSELFNVSVFKKIEADEMLTPDQLQDIRKGRPARIQPKQSNETMRTIETDGSETPNEPFHLQHLPSRIDAAGIKSAMPSPIQEVPTPIPSPLSSEGEHSPRPDAGQSPAVSPLPLDDQGITFTESPGTVEVMMALPPPPQKNPARFTPRKFSQDPLPTIPEIMVTGADRLSRAVNSPSDEFIYLQASSLTAQAPAFRHGLIRLTRPEPVVPEPKLDPTLDWTAFQMAILGGANDFFSDSVDFSHTAEADEADDLVSWFDSFGFSSPGRLVCEDRKKAREVQDTSLPPSPASSSSNEDGETNKVVTATSATSTTSAISATSSPPAPAPASASAPAPAPACASASVSPTSSQEMVQISNLPIAVAHEFPSGFWKEESNRTTGKDVKSNKTTTTDLKGNGNTKMDAAKFYEAQGIGLRRWTAAEGGGGQHHVRKKSGTGARHHSVDSLPQSPMLELVIAKGVEGKEYAVPMGYNLGHDLGEFLKFEAEYAYPSTFTDDE